MNLEMRELRGDDLFALLSIVGKLDIKDEFLKMFKKNAEATKKQPQDHKKKEPTKAEKEQMEAEAKERGMVAMANLAQRLLLNIGNVKDDINSLLADLCGVNVKEIKSLNLKDYTALILQFFQKPELKDFFTSIASLL